MENNIEDNYGGNFLKKGDERDLMDCKFLLRSFDITVPGICNEPPNESNYKYDLQFPY